MREFPLQVTQLRRRKLAILARQCVVLPAQKEIVEPMALPQSSFLNGLYVRSKIASVAAAHVQDLTPPIIRADHILATVRKPGMEPVEVDLNPHPHLEQMKRLADMTINSRLPPNFELFRPLLPIASHEEWQMLLEHINRRLSSLEWRMWQLGRDISRFREALGRPDVVERLSKMVDTTFTAIPCGPEGASSIVSFNAEQECVQPARLLTFVMKLLAILFRKCEMEKTAMPLVATLRQEVSEMGIKC